MSPRGSGDVLPVLLVGAVDPLLVSVAVGGLACDLPGSVLLSYTSGPDGVRRLVSDARGTVYDDIIAEDGCCRACAVRNDLLASVQMLVDQHRWTSLVLAPPATTDCQPLARLLSDADRDGDLVGAHLSAVLAFVNLPTLAEDLLGDDLLDDRGLALAPNDRRSVGESLATLIEFADVVVALPESGEPRSLELLDAVRSDSAVLSAGWDGLDTADLLEQRHDHAAAGARSHPFTLPSTRERDAEGVWTLELASTRPLDPTRLLQNIEQLGGGSIRARGYFWLASRPDVACAWDAAGGQLSIGVLGGWSGRMPQTRLVVTGTKAEERHRIAGTFPAVVCTKPYRYGLGDVDGLEPWLGAIDRRSPVPD